jgi:TPR repeat protein
VQAPQAADSIPKPVAPVPPDDAGALAHYRQLASQGNGDAALKLGEMYEAGRGVVQSNNWAYSWYLVAEKRGITAAKPRKDLVAAKLQPRERQQAEHFAERQAGQAR